jgi:hypothetical protein
VVERWWRKWPNSNIGIACGPSGLAVFDVDGPEGYDQLLSIINPIPNTLAVQTRRGAHLYFQGSCPSSSRARDGEKLDVRGQGGYVVAPPSVHASGFQYRWLNPLATLAPLPEPLAAWARTRGRRAPTRGAAAGGTGAGLGPRPTWLPAIPAGLMLAPRAAAGCELPVDLAAVDRALDYIPADCPMDQWVAVGMALKAGGLPLEVWDEWSQQAPEKYKENEPAYRWSTFKDGERGLGTLFFEAKKYGYTEVYDEPIKSEVNGHSGHNGHHALPPQFTTNPQNHIQFADLSKDGGARATCMNTRLALRKLGVTCQHDVFHGKMLVGGQPIAQWAGELSDDAVHMLRVLIRREFGFDPGKDHAFDAAIQECLQHPFDPVVNWLDALVWDGIPRLKEWLAVYLGAEASALNGEIGRLCLVAAVRRAKRPGCKFDQIIVLEGTEGRGKSSAIEIMAGEENFSDQTILGLDDRSQQEAVKGVWLYEIADLARHGRAEVETVKAFASRRSDRARPAYGRARIDQPRRCIFFATTNNETYLKSQTGNRRFWPVKCETVDLEALARDRDQLWAEAVAVERTGAPITLDSKWWECAAELQDSRRDHDPWEDILATVPGKEGDEAGGRVLRVTTVDLLSALQISGHQATDTHVKRVAFIMRRLGWNGPKVIREGKKLYRGYFKPLVTG